MMKEFFFFLWAFILPLYTWGRDYDLNQQLRQQILPYLVPHRKRKYRLLHDSFPVFCQDVILILPMVGILLIMCIFIFNNLGPDKGFPKSSQLFGYFCLVQLSILDLVRGLKMRPDKEGYFHYNWPLFWGIFVFTVLHILSINYLMYSWDISLFCLIILSLIASVKTWQYIERFYKK